MFLGCGIAGLAFLTLQRSPFGIRPGTDRPYSRAHQQLLASFEETRLVEARITGERAYRPYRPSARPADPSSPPPSDTRSNAALSRQRVPAEIFQNIERTVLRDPSPENRAALAVLRLVEGDPATAASSLRSAHIDKPDDPRLLNDLAAALLTVSRDTGDPWPALEAIEVTQRSLRLAPSLPALFNQSLALERWGLRSRAIAGWRSYLEKDGRSDWADEARRRLADLERKTQEDRAAFRALDVPVLDLPTLARNPWAARQRGERMLLARWAQETLADRQSAAKAALDEAEALIAALPTAAGRLLEASVAVIREAQQTGDQARLARLARGHQAFGKALSLARGEQKAAAFPLLDRAIRDLRAAASPFELHARVQRALIAAEPDWAELREVDRIARDRGFPSVAAEARYIAAYRISLEGRLEAAVEAYQDARRLFDELREEEKSAVIAVMLAELLDALGRRHEAGTELSRALAAGPWVADAWNRYTIYVVAASTSAAHFGRAAVELRLEAADACRDLPGRPLCAVDSWLWVAALTPDADFAESSLLQAEELLLATPRSDGRERTSLDLTTAWARWLARDDASSAEREKAAELYLEAVAGYEARGRAVSAARARAARAKILQSLERVDEAFEEYRSGLAAIRLWDRSERFRPESAETSPRELRFIYESLIDLELDAARGGPSPSAFLLSEEMRDRLAPRRSTESWRSDQDDAGRFAARMPPATALIEYAIFGEQAVVWILSRGGLDQVLLTPGDKLGRRIRSLARERSARDWKNTSGRLFQELLSPALRRLPTGTERLVVVPDSELHSLPFRALWDPGSGRYLDEMFTVTLAPSVRQFLEEGDTQAGPAGPGLPLPVLSLGFGAFDPDLRLDPLPWAEKEAAAVRERYRGGPSSQCPATDWASFRRCAPEADVLHLATHASADSTVAEWTWLAFPQGTVSLTRLWRELPDLPRHPLVVLSACESVTATSGEGLGGLARPFLANGARAVVGTLWKISDRDAANLFPAFHQAYLESQNAAEALRKTREAVDGWAEKPWVWGGVQVVGERRP